MYFVYKNISKIRESIEGGIFISKMATRFSAMRFLNSFENTDFVFGLSRKISSAYEDVVLFRISLVIKL